MTLGEILEIEGLPRRLIVAFAAACAKDALSKVPDPDPRSVLAVEVATRYGDGEDFTETYLREVINAAAIVYAAPAAITYAAHAAHAAAYASLAYLAAHAAHAAAYASWAYLAATRSSCSSTAECCKSLLIDMINKRLTKVEMFVVFGLDKVSY